MDKILEKLTTYNLFNYLLPGVLFAVFLESFTVFSITQENLVVGAFVYYFAGLIISRFGSLIVQPILQKIHFLEFVEYKDYITASQKDSIVETLSEVNNMYRTFTAMIVLLVIFKLYELLLVTFPKLIDWSPHILVFLLLTMFLFSYRKQTGCIKSRIEHAVK